MAAPTPDTLPEQRVERRPERQRQPFVEREECQRQAHQGINGPGMKAPVKNRGAHCEPTSLGRARFGAQRRAGPAGEIGQRFGGAPEHQADADAGGKQHG